MIFEYYNFLTYLLFHDYRNYFWQKCNIYSPYHFTFSLDTFNVKKFSRFWLHRLFEISLLFYFKILKIFVGVSLGNFSMMMIENRLGSFTGGQKRGERDLQLRSNDKQSWPRSNPCLSLNRQSRLLDAWSRVGYKGALHCSLPRQRYVVCEFSNVRVGGGRLPFVPVYLFLSVIAVNQSFARIRLIRFRGESFTENRSGNHPPGYPIYGEIIRNFETTK